MSVLKTLDVFKMVPYHWKPLKKHQKGCSKPHYSFVIQENPEAF